MKAGSCRHRVRGRVVPGKVRWKLKLPQNSNCSEFKVNQECIPRKEFVWLQIKTSAQPHKMSETAPRPATKHAWFHSHGVPPHKLAPRILEPQTQKRILPCKYRTCQVYPLRTKVIVYSRANSHGEGVPPNRAACRLSGEPLSSCPQPRPTLSQGIRIVGSYTLHSGISQKPNPVHQMLRKRKTRKPSSPRQTCQDRIYKRNPAYPTGGSRPDLPEKAPASSFLPASQVLQTGCPVQLRSPALGVSIVEKTVWMLLWWISPAFPPFGPFSELCHYSFHIRQGWIHKSRIQNLFPRHPNRQTCLTMVSTNRVTPLPSLSPSAKNPAPPLVPRGFRAPGPARSSRSPGAAGRRSPSPSAAPAPARCTGTWRSRIADRRRTAEGVELGMALFF